MNEKTYSVYWYEKCSEEDMDRGYYEEKDKSFDNYKEAVEYFEKIKSVGKYNVQLSRQTNEILDESIVESDNKVTEISTKKIYVTLEFEAEITDQTYKLDNIINYDKIEEFVKNNIISKIPEELKCTKKYRWCDTPSLVFYDE